MRFTFSLLHVYRAGALALETGVQRVLIGSALQDCNGRRGYTLEVLSTNCLVPYTLSVDGKIIPITDNDLQVVNFPGGTSPSGNSHRIDVQIGDISGATAGDYYDLISISIYSYR